jgi:hypothetical protein
MQFHLERKSRSKTSTSTNSNKQRSPNGLMKPQLQRQLALLERVLERVNEACVRF